MRSPIITIRADSGVNRFAIASNGIIAIPHDNRQVMLYDMTGQRVTRIPRTARNVNTVLFHLNLDKKLMQLKCHNFKIYY